MKHALRRNKGFGLLPVLMSSLILSIVIVGTQAMMRTSFNTDRGIASNIDLSETINSMRLMLETKKSCEKSGLIGTEFPNPLAPPVNNAIQSVPASIAFNMPGRGPIVAGGLSLGNSRRVVSLGFSHLEEIENIGVNTSYLATLRLVTAVDRGGITSRNPTAEFRLKLLLNPANQIIECYTYPSSKGGILDIASIGPLNPAMVNITGATDPIGNWSCTGSGASENCTLTKPFVQFDYTAKGDRLTVQTSAVLAAMGLDRTSRLQVQVEDIDSSSTVIPWRDALLWDGYHATETVGGTLTSQELVFNAVAGKNYRVSYRLEANARGIILRGPTPGESMTRNLTAVVKDYFSSN